MRNSRARSRARRSARARRAVGQILGERGGQGQRVVGTPEGHRSALLGRSPDVGSIPATPSAPDDRADRARTASNISRARIGNAEPWNCRSAMYRVTILSFSPHPLDHQVFDQFANAELKLVKGIGR